MKKLYIVLMVWMVFSQPIFTQSLSFYPDDTVYHNFTVINNPEIGLYIFNASNDSITIKWNKISNLMPQGWDYSICDLGTCYTGIPLGGTMQKMSTSDTAFLKLTVFNNNIPGEGKVVIKLEPKPGEYDTVVFHISNYPLDAKNLSGKNINYNVFPNPAADVISVYLNNIENSKITFTNILGEVVKQEILLDEKNSISVSDLQEGIYFASIYSEGNIVETRKIVISR